MFQVVEWTDKDGVLHSDHWSQDDGYIFRSSKGDNYFNLKASPTDSNSKVCNSS